MSPTNQSVQEPHHRYAEEMAALLLAVLQSPGLTDPVTREAAFRGSQLPPQLSEYVTKIFGKSYRITDEDIDLLLAAGSSQDAIFEITVAAALGAATQRLEAGLRAMKQAGS